MSTSKIVILVFAAVLALILGIAVVSKMHTAAVMRKFNDGRYAAGTFQVKSLHYKVQLYILDTGSVPGSLDALVSAPAGVKGWQGPYADSRQFVDPFGHPFAYKAPGDHGDFDIVFFGADGKPGGVHNDADVGNWELNIK